MTINPEFKGRTMENKSPACDESFVIFAMAFSLYCSEVVMSIDRYLVWNAGRRMLCGLHWPIAVANRPDSHVF